MFRSTLGVRWAMDGETCQATPGCMGVVEDGYCTVCGKIALRRGHTPVGRPAGPMPPRTAVPAAPAVPGAPLPGAPLPAAPPTGAWGGRLPTRPPTRPPTGPPSRPMTTPPSTPVTNPPATTPPSSSPSVFTNGTTGTSPSGHTLVPGSRRALGTSRRPTARSRIGAGLVSVSPMPTLDPLAAVMANPEVSEDKRFCPRCGAEVGRSRDGKPGRLTGFCSKCRQAYSFLPPLGDGDLVAGQYRIAGCLAYGGLGWIYLAQDEQVSNRWVVLKGLLNSGDADAMAAAAAERQFLARVEHPNVVRIYNFVQHSGAGYTVMEYVGGKPLREILRERRLANGSDGGALPVEHAIAYILAILPAFSYLHRLGLVYNDFKPDNVMLQGDDVKLIDLGAVTRMDDTSAAVYGTDGYQAPEVARLGPSAASDLYSVARCLAALVLDFRGYQTKYRYSLPDPSEQPLFARYESLYRFLLKGTAENPDDRFQNADEMSEQLIGVLREVVAAKDRTPRAAASSLFGGDLQALYVNAGAPPGKPDWRHLPMLKVNPADPAASFVVNVSALTDQAEQVAFLQRAIAQGQVPETAEARLGLARALIGLGAEDQAERHLEEINRDDPWDWRVTWYRGLSLLMRGRSADARRAFERIAFDLPGELAPKLAEALATEQTGDLLRAAVLYDVVSATDPSFTSACFGLARVQDAMGDRSAAVDAYRRLQEGSSLYVPAQTALVRTLMRTGAQSAPGIPELSLASATLQRLGLEGRQRWQLTIELLESALGLVGSGAVRPDRSVELLRHRLEERALRLGLERSYRQLARLATGDERIGLVDRANEVRPLTAV